MYICKILLYEIGKMIVFWFSNVEWYKFFLKLFEILISLDNLVKFCKKIKFVFSNLFC